MKATAIAKVGIAVAAAMKNATLITREGYRRRARSEHGWNLGAPRLMLVLSAVEDVRHPAA